MIGREPEGFVLNYNKLISKFENKELQIGLLIGHQCKIDLTIQISDHN